MKVYIVLVDRQFDSDLGGVIYSPESQRAFGSKAKALDYIRTILIEELDLEYNKTVNLSTEITDDSLDTIECYCDIHSGYNDFTVKVKELEIE